MTGHLKKKMLVEDMRGERFWISTVLESDIDNDGWIHALVITSTGQTINSIYKIIKTKGDGNG